MRHWWMLGCAAVLSAQPSIDRVKQKILADLERLPNYTCAESIERRQRLAGARKFEFADRVRLEVGYAGGHEVFGWPGGEKLAEEDLTRLVAGTISNGDFALLANGLFSNAAAQFAAAGLERRDGRDTWRWDYRVPQEWSDWVLQVPGRQAAVAYHGSFWVDKERLDLLALDITADRIPVSLGFDKVVRSLRYARVRIGAEDFVLPEAATLSTVELAGHETRSETRFHGCRQYTVETAIRFEPGVEMSPPNESARAPGAAPVVLPAEFEAELELDDGIDSEAAAAGELFAAHLRESVRHGDREVIPKAAVLRGRITRLDVIAGRRFLDLDFLYFEFGGRRVDLRERVNRFAVQVWNLRDGRMPARGLPSGASIRTASSRIEGPIHADGHLLRLPRGYRIFLRSSAR